MALQAVITGDIVNSTKLVTIKEKKLYAEVLKIFSEHTIEFYRGDSFQVYVKSAAEALRLALLCRIAAITASGEEKEKRFDVRVSIGIGKVNLPVKSLSTAKGEAFILSGRAFDELLKANTRLAVSVANELANEAMQVIADYLNVIFKEMTGKQARVICGLLKGDTQQAVARKLKKTKSTINQHVSSGRWSEIERLLQQYENIIKLSA